MTPSLLLAADGGNSKTDLALVSADGELLATVRGPGFRPHTHGVQGAVERLSDSVAAALAQAGADKVTHLSACLAGADSPEDEQRLEEALAARGWALSVRVQNDTFALLRIGSASGLGVAVVCGAGINCVGSSPDGRTLRFPSLGRITGDWGGGGELGHEALWHGVRAEDGRGPATVLAEAVAAHFGVESALDVGLALHRKELDPEQLTTLAPVLMDAAEAGDPVAREISDRLAEEVVRLGEVALRKIGMLDRPAEVVLGGGVLTARRAVLMDTIEWRYAERAPHAHLIVADAPPVLGAALFGLDRLDASPAAHEALRAAYRT
jgi:N-acetylglucosamine kinase-like BadF-type ATPase